jgi:aryl sulfotransferase
MDNLDRDLIGRLLDRPLDDSPAPRRSGDTELRGRLLQWILTDESVQTNLDTLCGVVWHLSGAWDSRHDGNVVLLHYSDLQRDLEGQMRRLATRLGIDVEDQVWPDLVEAATFDRMRQRSADLVPDEQLGILKDTTRFFGPAHRGSGASC